MPLKTTADFSKIPAFFCVQNDLEKRGQSGKFSTLTGGKFSTLIDIRYIQEMLGHSNLHTTEIYTHVSIDKLIAVHGATHPSRLQRHRNTDSNPVSNHSLDQAKASLLKSIADEEQNEAEAPP